MSGSINITVDQVQANDYVHWENPRCPGDQYGQVVEVFGDRVVVIVLGVRRFIKRNQITSAVRNELRDAKRGPIIPLGRGPWGRLTLGT